MWAAAFGFAPEFTPFALIKYENQQTSIYSDGLNFLKEAFDLTIFRDSLLIMTTGGELYTFNDENIQRFTPKPRYCPGDKIELTLATNSAFATENKTSFVFKSMTGEPKATVSAEAVNGNQFIMGIPAELSEGSYQLQTNTTVPYIRSNVSSSFIIYNTPPAPIEQSQQGEFVTLSTVDGNGLHYQWQRDGQDIVSANSASFQTNEPGNYAVIVSNEGGCTNKSLAINVRLDAPSEVTLLQNAPNPIGLTTDISFFLPIEQNIKLSVYDSRGHEITTLAAGKYSTGWHLARFDARNLPSGVYIYQLKAGNLTKTLKMVR